MRHSSSSKDSSSRIRIAVRVRPLSAEETAKGCSCVIERVNNNGVRVWDPTSLDFRGSGDAGLTASWSRDFFYDHCLWSVSSRDSNFANQQSIFEAVGRPVVDFVLAGYNTCVLAYGQTGAGKSYTMLGSSRETSQYGLIPRICFSLFEDLEQASAHKMGHEFSVDFSYLEIYNETLR
jgi:kinesin family protein 1